MTQLSLTFDATSKSSQPPDRNDTPQFYPTALTSRPLSNYLSALGLLRLQPRLKGYWQGDRFWLDTDPKKVVSSLLKHYQPSPLFTPWNKGGGWLVQTGKANARHIQTLRDSSCDRFARMREGIEIIDRVYAEAEAEGCFAKGDYADKDKSDGKTQFVTRIYREAPQLVEWIEVVYAFFSEETKTIALAGKAGSEGTGEYSKTFADALFAAFDLDGRPQPRSDRALRSLLMGDNAPVQTKISPGLYDPSAGGLSRRFTDGSKLDPMMNPWLVLLFMEGILTFASETRNRLDGRDWGSAAIPFAVRASNVGYSSAANEGFKLELWVPLWSSPCNATKLKALFRRGRSRLDDSPVRDGLQFARSLPQYARRTGIERLERYGILERASERGNTWACHLGTFFTKQPDAVLIAQAERWVNGFSKAANSRTLKERYFETLTGQRRLEDFIIALGDSLVRADRSPKKFGHLKRPELDKAWAERLLAKNNCPEMRLAIALSQGWAFRNRLQAASHGDSKESSAPPLLQWTQADPIAALIAANRNWVLYASQQNQVKSLPSGFLTHARLDDLTLFIRGETDNLYLWALARGLRAVQGQKVNLKIQQGVAFPPGFEAIAICWHCCKLWWDNKPTDSPNSKDATSQQQGEKKTLPDSPNSKDATSQQQGEKTKTPLPTPFPYEGQMLNGLATGQKTTTKTAIDAALRRLRTREIFPTLKKGHFLPTATAHLWAAALAFPLNNSSLRYLIRSLTNTYKKQEDDSSSTET